MAIEAMKKALEAINMLLDRIPSDMEDVQAFYDAGGELRQAIEYMENVEPAAWIRTDGAKAMVDAEKSAWIDSGNSSIVQDYTIPAFLAPPALRGLRRNELLDVASKAGFGQMLSGDLLPAMWHGADIEKLERFAYGVILKAAKGGA